MSSHNGGVGDDTATTAVSFIRLQQLELDAQRTQLLQTRVADLEAALQIEQARNDKHADAFMQIARSSDSRAQEMETQHAAAIAKLETAKSSIIEKLEQSAAVKDATIAELKATHAAAISKLEAEVAALKAQGALKLTEIHAAVAALQTLEIYPVRPTDSRQFATWHCGAVPAIPTTFDRAWAAALYHRDKYTADVDVTGTRVSVTSSVPASSSHHLTFRSAVPLSRPRCLLSPSPNRSAALITEQQQLPSYRVVVEAYGARSYCYLGFIPSHVTRANGVKAQESANPTLGHHICRYGGWDITVYPSKDGAVDTASGWVVLPPPVSAESAGSAENAAAGQGGGQCSAYATTDTVPPVPEGGAVEFAVDYDSGTCRVAFYTPMTVIGGFVEPPHAKMELRFVAIDADYTAGRDVPARPLPTAADSSIALFPAVGTHGTGAAVRFVS